MGQEQYKNSDGKGQDATGSSFKRNDLKDRANAKFESRTKPVVNPATGDGAKGNPGKPV